VLVREKPMLLTVGKSWFAKLFHSPPGGGAEKRLADAESGDAQAQFNLGLSFSNRPDFGQAAHWYLKAANQDHAKAQFALGVMFADGRGVPQDEAKALIWIGKAAERGCSEAQRAMGSRCRRASFQKTPQDALESNLEAYKWFRLASAQGCKESESEFEYLAISMTQEQVIEGNRRVTTLLASVKDR
jgi:TPR repeat protein